MPPMSPHQRYCRVCHKVLGIKSEALTEHELKCFQEHPEQIPKSLMRVYLNWLNRQKQSKARSKGWLTNPNRNNNRKKAWETRRKK